MIGFDPDLQQPAGLCACIDFAVHDSGSGAHPLHISSLNHAAVSGRILMLELSFDHHRDDFHVAMGMHAKTPSCRNRVVIDHKEGAESHPVGIVMTGERKAMPRLKPVANAVKAFLGWTEHQRWLVCAVGRSH